MRKLFIAGLVGFLIVFAYVVGPVVWKQIIQVSASGDAYPETCRRCSKTTNAATEGLCVQCLKDTGHFRTAYP